ncbi:GPCR, rhodopsin-like, 7TM,Leucine-rich repeat,Leucine-rich repeat domain, L domain-like,G protein- [Cinara cedri]|uniref:GPCR, rhodopsin-like, 7TM,Leucine-rich repeat,Leucine-rich repeat domain, L domain-like,G protein n=1 Tax=Cinara cedri TaxID=506608 RepID=A0A5E4MYW4_9HEMI|nr:GPCR, rhodopsin-like, 7TM,Leucine-rich repeat,Leucine-rich repeat domain, L domain-like,G protein- [Cinara cedri]
MVTGSKQGALSPLLFNIILDKIVRSIQRDNCGIDVSTMMIGILGFCDDLNIVGDDGENMKQSTAAFINEAKTIGLAENNDSIRGNFKELINSDKNNITEIILNNLKNLTHLDSSTFKNLNGLQSLSISIARSLKELPLDIFCGLSQSFNVLKIRKTNLKVIPDLSDLGNPNAMHTIEFEENNFDVLPTNGIKTRAALLLLENNKIRVIENWAFNGSEIAELNLRGNPLNILSEHSFEGIINLRKIDLSDSSMKIFPIFGLENIEAIRLENTILLTIIPPIYTLANLKEVRLTYPFHCCSFKYSTQEYSSEYEFDQDFQQKDDCIQMKENNPSFNFVSQNVSQSNQFVIRNEEESFLDKPAIIIGSQDVKCGQIIPSTTKSIVQCSPKPDDLNPCEDIMGQIWLRISVWIVGIGALLPNFVVMLVAFRKKLHFSVPRFLMGNLAFADFFTAVYLLLLAYEDVISKDNYFNYASTWQYGIGCKIGGFLAVFSSQLSIFTLCMLTVERWFSIRRALYTTKLSFTSTVRIMAIGWIYSIVMAALPLMGISSYSTTSICLPMDTSRLSGVLYILVLLSFGTGAFLLMLTCYVQMYMSVSYETRHAVPGEASLARKILLLVGTNFMCITPVIFFGFTALAGYPLIGISESKILLVFIYPINSCANPFLYTILTACFRREVMDVVTKVGKYMESDKEYKVIYSTNNINQRITIQQTPKTISSAVAIQQPQP